jgi:hypothetical protein
MREFVLNDSMVNMSGVFYPTGYAVVMFPSEEDCRATAAALEQAGFSGDDVQHLSPATVFKEVSRTDKGNEEPMPSVGTESATVRTFAALARQGHHGLIVSANSAEDAERVMEIVRRVPFSLAQKYRTLVIEDLN